MPRIEMITEHLQLPCAFQLQDARCRSSGQDVGAARQAAEEGARAMPCMLLLVFRFVLAWAFRKARANTFENQIAVQTETMPLRLYYGLAVHEDGRTLVNFSTRSPQMGGKLPVGLSAKMRQSC